MTGIRIIAKTEVGQSIIASIFNADNGRNDWVPFFNERVEHDNPYRIVIEHKNRLARSLMKTGHLVALVRKQLDGLGGVFGIDYDVVPL